MSAMGDRYGFRLRAVGGPNGPRAVNVDRMRRYAHRTDKRHVWTPEERQALLDHMYGTLDRWREEDGLPPMHRISRVEVRGE